ncbi:MAG: SDR family oxidoreductase [Oxalobacteraceae bacterium]|jgi:NAD(P)-dependent dehydrogenase (short-subunit alcohol dehydrogenase family)|nr:SDR family oxidoreductase [Oxalobacteraceae bacterium]
MTHPVILITGGSRGIGAATAILAAKRGYDVVFTYQSNAKAANEVAEAIRATGRKALMLQADVAIEADVLNVFKQIDAQMGQLNALVNNAGVLEKIMRLDQMDAARWQRILSINVIGSFLCAKEAVLRMSTRHGGNGGGIVNVSSAAARIGSPNEFIDYAAAKGAVDSMTIGLSKEVAAENIRVNAVRPGLIYTEIHASAGEPGRVDRAKEGVPMKRGGTADEVAETILWLLSDQSSYITGTMIDVAGGR